MSPRSPGTIGTNTFAAMAVPAASSRSDTRRRASASPGKSSAPAGNAAHALAASGTPRWPCQALGARFARDNDRFATAPGPRSPPRAMLAEVSERLLHRHWMCLTHWRVWSADRTSSIADVMTEPRAPARSPPQQEHAGRPGPRPSSALHALRVGGRVTGASRQRSRPAVTPGLRVSAFRRLAWCPGDGPLRQVTEGLSAGRRWIRGWRLAGAGRSTGNWAGQEILRT